MNRWLVENGKPPLPLNFHTAKLLQKKPAANGVFLFAAGFVLWVGVLSLPAHAGLTALEQTDAEPGQEDCAEHERDAKRKDRQGESQHGVQQTEGLHGSDLLFEHSGEEFRQALDEIGTGQPLRQGGGAEEVRQGTEVRRSEGCGGCYLCFHIA